MRDLPHRASKLKTILDRHLDVDDDVWNPEADEPETRRAVGGPGLESLGFQHGLQGVREVMIVVYDQNANGRSDRRKYAGGSKAVVTMKRRAR
jgi:hypothetical protein